VDFIEHIIRTADHNRGLCILVTPPTLVGQTEGATPALGLGPHVVDETFVADFVQTTKESMERCIAADGQRGSR
jgi:hypothetical protein